MDDACFPCSPRPLTTCQSSLPQDVNAGLIFLFFIPQALLSGWCRAGEVDTLQTRAQCIKNT